MRLVTISITAEDIKVGQTPTSDGRMGSCGMFRAASRVLPDLVMVGRDRLLCYVFGIDLPPEAVAWNAHADRHFQGLEKNPPKPLTFNVIHPL